jgi:hypothetical protein
VCRQGKVLEVDCKGKGASIRCGLEAGDGEAGLGGGGGTSFQYYQGKQKKKKNIPLLYHYLIGQ